MSDVNSNKAKILQAASTLFLQGGTAALSVRAIANAAGVSTIGIYSHFDGKQGILDALYVEGFERVIEAMDVMTADMEPRAAVMLAAKNYLQVAEQHTAHYRLIFGESDGSYVPSAEATEVGAKAFAGVTAVVASLLPSSASRTCKIDAALQIWSVMHGSVSLRQHAIAEYVDMTHWKKRALQSVEMLIDGIVSKYAPP